MVKAGKIEIGTIQSPIFHTGYGDKDIEYYVVLTPTEEISKRVQDSLFKNGYSWGRGNGYQHTDQKALSIPTNGEKQIFYTKPDAYTVRGIEDEHLCIPLSFYETLELNEVGDYW